MYASHFIRTLLGSAAIAVIAAGCSESTLESPVAPTTGSDVIARWAPVKERPIMEFVLAQGGVAGSGMGASLGPSGGAIGWIDYSTGLTAVVDYAGSIYRREERWATTSAEVSKTIDDPAVEEEILEKEITESTDPVPPAIEPTYAGRIFEQMLPDGSVRVTIDLATKDALAFAAKDIAGQYEPIVFGAGAYRDAAAVRGESRLVVIYRTRVAGAPIPSLRRLFYEPQPGEAIEHVMFTATAASKLPPALGGGLTMSVDFKAYGGLGGSLAAIGTLSGAIVAIY